MSSLLQVGQIGFHKQKEVRKIRVSRRENVIVNRLNKTKEEKKVRLNAFFCVESILTFPL